MDPLEVLRAHIPEFPGYFGEHSRRLSDELVRSYLGEALVHAAGDAPLQADLQSRVDALLLRVGFADPRSFPPHGLVTGPAQAEDGEAAELDAAVVDLADRVRSVDLGSLAGVLDEVTSVLDRRTTAMRATAMRLAATPLNTP